MDWDDVIDKIQQFMVSILIVTVALSALTLIMFDVFAGVGAMEYLTGGKMLQSIIISLATTGLLIALMFFGWTLSQKKDAGSIGIGAGLILAATGVFILDVCFDALTADVFRYGMIVQMSNVENPSIHWMFRALIGGISTVGEAMAISIISGMPVLKNIIKSSISKIETHKQPEQKRVYQQIQNNLPKGLNK